jgi:hypothetical protein
MQVTTRGGRPVEFQVGGDERGRELGVGGGAGAGAPDLRGDVVELLAVLGWCQWYFVDSFACLKGA